MLACLNGARCPGPPNRLDETFGPQLRLPSDVDPVLARQSRPGKAHRARAAVIATVFGLIFVGQLPDKTAVAGLVLGTPFPWRCAFAGIAAASLTHVVIAVAAGSLLTLLPHRPVDAVVAALFFLGAVLIWREGQKGEQPRRPTSPRSQRRPVFGGWPRSATA